MPLINAPRNPRGNEAVYCDQTVDTGCVDPDSLQTPVPDVDVDFDRAGIRQQRLPGDLHSIDLTVLGNGKLSPNPRHQGRFVHRIDAWVTRAGNRYLRIRTGMQKSAGRYGRVEVLDFVNGKLKPRRRR